MPSIVGNIEAIPGNVRLRSRKGIPVYEESLNFIVLADSKTQARVEIVTQTPGLPQVGQVFGVAAVVAVSAVRRQTNSIYWDVAVELSSEIEEGQDGSSGSNQGGGNFTPEVWVPIYETKFERYQEVVTKDQSGTAIANSAGQAFETGLTVTRHIPIWEFYQFEPATVTDETVISRSEIVNSGTFKGKAAKSLLCVVLSSVVGFYYGQRRRLTQYQLKYNSRLWTHKRLDVGTQYLDTGALKDFVSSDGSIMLGSLNGSGARQTAGTDPAILEFDQYATNSFSFLRI